MKRIMIPIAVLALIVLTATSAAAVTYATVTGYMAFNEDANHAEFWGTNCTKDESVDGEESFELPAGFFGTVIVKAGTGEFAHTIFEDASGGETVWADTNGDGIFNVGGPGGDKEISHIITCVETPPTAPPTDVPPTDTPPTLPPATDTPTAPPVVTNPPDSTGPPTDTTGTPTGSDTQWLLVVALGVLLSSLVILRPKRR